MAGRQGKQQAINCISVVARLICDGVTAAVAEEAKCGGVRMVFV
jgi:hypothetical protein